jgi:hypothetical protein
MLCFGRMLTCSGLGPSPAPAATARTQVARGGLRNRVRWLPRPATVLVLVAAYPTVWDRGRPG